MPRLFVGIDAGDAVRRAVDEVLPRLRALSPRSKWVPVENLHLTVVFLGSVDDGRVSESIAALDRAVEGHAARTFRLEGGGTFGARARPRVLWAGVAGREGALEALRALHADVERAFEGLGHAPETRTYSPHLTLARARDMRGDRELAACVPVLEEALPGAGADAAGVPLPVTELVLFQSHTGPGGARYEPLHRSVLGRLP